MKLGHFKANQRDRVNRSINEALPWNQRRIVRLKGSNADFRSKPFVPGMYERKTPEQVRATVGTDPHHTFVPVTR